MILPVPGFVSSFNKFIFIPFLPLLNKCMIYGVLLEQSVVISPPKEFTPCTGLFIMFSVVTNIYNKKTKGPTLMEFFTATGKLKNIFFNFLQPGMFDVWQELEYRIDVCLFTRDAHI
jgi:hypothetical protein